MFDVPKPGSRATRISLLASFLIHCLVVSLWLNRPPIFVQPSSVAWGMHGNSESVTYLAQTSEKPLTTGRQKTALSPEAEIKTAGSADPTEC